MNMPVVAAANGVGNTEPITTTKEHKVVGGKEYERVGCCFKWHGWVGPDVSEAGRNDSPVKLAKIICFPKTNPKVLASCYALAFSIPWALASATSPSLCSQTAAFPRFDLSANFYPPFLSPTVSVLLSLIPIPIPIPHIHLSRNIRWRANELGAFRHTSRVDHLGTMAFVCGCFRYAVWFINVRTYPPDSSELFGRYVTVGGGCFHCVAVSPVAVPVKFS
ncbi:hypothetical protein V6N13_105948 [Hibiscus sabdariffa]